MINIFAIFSTWIGGILFLWSLIYANSYIMVYQDNLVIFDVFGLYMPALFPYIFTSGIVIFWTGVILGMLGGVGKE